ncbi:MAG TPA: hypothetical protein V6D28_08995 [Leptolyngbyaceae cyanobacterium]
MANTNFGKMFKKTYLLGILTAGTLGLLSFAAEATPRPCCGNNAGGDNAVIQTSQQQATVTGKNNAIEQNATQSVRTNPTVRPAARTAQKKPAQTRTRARRTVHRPAATPCKTVTNAKH